MCCFQAFGIFQRTPFGKEIPSGGSQAGNISQCCFLRGGSLREAPAARAIARSSRVINPKGNPCSTEGLGFSPFPIDQNSTSSDD